MRTNKIIEELKKKFPGLKITSEGEHVRIGQVTRTWQEARNIVK